MESYLELCYSPLVAENHHNSSLRRALPNASFIVWYNNDFGLCFEYLTFSAFLGALFCIVSALYAGCNYTKIQRRRKPLALILRGIISLSIMLTFLVDFVGGFWLSPGRPYSVIVSLVVQILAWTVHVHCIWVLSCSATHYGRGPLNLYAAWILTFVGSILQLRTTIRWKLNQEPYQRSSLPIEDAYFSDLTEIIVYIVFSLQCLYALSLILKVNRVTGDNVSVQPIVYQGINQRKVEWTDDVDKSVHQHLISSKWTTEHAHSSYGTLPHPHSDLSVNLGGGNVGEIDASEDHASLFSCLSFWWVEPLMRRGALGFLRKPEDLLQLPKSLNTSKMREKFRKTRERNVRSSDSGDELDATDDDYGTRGTLPTSGGVVIGAGCVNNVTVDDRNKGDGGNADDESDSEGDELWYDSLSLNMKGATPDATQQIRSQKRKKGHTGETEGDHVEESLFWSLNRAFGLHYYPLGILKLVADMLGFSGPLLLHALVLFMENKTVRKLCIITLYLCQMLSKVLIGFWCRMW